MDFIDYIVDESTPLELIPFIKAYAPHRAQPARRDLLEVEYEMWETTGHCTLKGLVAQAGFNYEDEIERMRAMIKEDEIDEVDE